MRKPATATRTAPRRGGPRPRSTEPGRIHPVVIYPIRQPADYGDLEALYDLVTRLDGDQTRYARPLTVMDRKTFYAMAGDAGFQQFRQECVARCSDLIDAWCVDTCQMWYAGLGQAFERGQPGDVYWLIPGDFNYGSAAGREVLNRLHDLPEIILELNQDLCIGEIAAGPDHPKQLIDTYGTFALLYCWFPQATEEIRQFTERPRSEFFALSHAFLQEALQQRWYAYEQTMVMLLQAVMSRRHISRFFVGHITDLPGGREPLAAALQQVERTERVLKVMWQDQHQEQPDWMERYRGLETQSEQVLRAALTVLHHLLG